MDELWRWRCYHHEMINKVMVRTCRHEFMVQGDHVTPQARIDHELQAGHTSFERELAKDDLCRRAEAL